MITRSADNGKSGRLLSTDRPAGHSTGTRLASGIVLTALFLAQIACARTFVSRQEGLPTAVSPAQVATFTQAVIPTETPTRAPAIGGGNIDPLPIAATALPITATALPTQATPAQTVVIFPQASPTPGTPAATAAPAGDQTQGSPIIYYTQAGDTLKALAVRFGVNPEEIVSPRQPIVKEGLFDPGVLLLIPSRLTDVSESKPLIPDSEVVYSPSALDFDLNGFVTQAGGKLNSYSEWRTNGWHNGPQVIQRVATENSVNPRLLLAILEIQSHWVYGQPSNLAETDYPIGWLHLENEKKGLYYQLSWAVSQLNIGYYGWRDGTLPMDLKFPDGKTLRLAPDLNAGTVSLLYLFSRLYNQQEWAGILYGPDGLQALYEKMFGNPWIRAQTVEPLFPATLTQPQMELPFLPGHTWALTGGPHSAWAKYGANAALDFAPSSVESGCLPSTEWVTASAAGLVVRSEFGVVVVDLDSDGYEQTGWSILYLHIATKDRVPNGTWVDVNDPIGHPSCEGGSSTGTHVHIARKYNGEWILADGPMPFVLSGWRAHAGKDLYIGTLTKDGQTVESSVVGSFESRITRPKVSQ